MTRRIEDRVIGTGRVTRGNFVVWDGESREAAFALEEDARRWVELMEEGDVPITTPYTVIGVHEDLFENGDAEAHAYVEWVEAITPNEAVKEARAKASDREDSIVVAVLIGHLPDMAFNQGLAS